MRVLIVSDTHRLHKNLDIALEQAGKIDLLLHMGDVEGGEDYIEAVAGCPVRIVAGNNDFFSQLNREEEVQLGNHRIFMTHGHYYYVSVGMERIKEEGLSRGADIVMFGHTHRPYLDIGEKITVLNPGSLSYPRQDGRKPSYMLMEIDRNGEAHYTVCYVDQDRDIPSGLY